MYMYNDKNLRKLSRYSSKFYLVFLFIFFFIKFFYWIMNKHLNIKSIYKLSQLHGTN